MHILITGAAGMIGRKITERLLKDGRIGEREITKLTLHDVVAPDAQPTETTTILPIVGDISDRTRGRPAGGGEARHHHASRGDRLGRGGGGFRQGLRRQFRRHAAPLRGDPRLQNYRPRVIFASSIAVFGTPFPEPIPDEFHLTPLTSYGTQKAVGELLLNDYSRRGFFDGIGLRLPTICVRPGKPNKAASGFFSNIIREPLKGEEAVLPVAETCATGMRARARRSASSCTRRRWTSRRSGRAAASPCPASRRRSASRSRRCARSPATRR